MPQERTESPQERPEASDVIDGSRKLKQSLLDQLKWVNDQMTKGRFRAKAVRSIKDGTVTEEKSHVLAMAAAGQGLVELGYVDIVGNFVAVPNVKGTDDYP